jgi:transcriptional regulator with XRE-family HTH domain
MEAEDGMFANLGPALRLVRERRGTSQAEVARKAGIGKSQLSKYEQGKELPKLESLERVLAVLNLGSLAFFYALHLLDRRADQPPKSEPHEDMAVAFERVMRHLLDLHRQVVLETARSGIQREDEISREGQ